MLLKKRVYILKKRPTIITLSLTILIFLCLISVSLDSFDEEPILSYAVANQVIVIDAGHGGIDPGAISKRNNLEKDVTLAISKKLDRYLGQAGALVINLRENDSDLAGDEFTGSIRERKRKDLAARVEIANDNKADIYISVHTNSVPNPQWSGSQTFYKKGSEEGKILAQSIQEELIHVLGNTKRDAKAGSYFILDRTKMPTVIVEVGFMSNPAEEKLLTNADYQEKVAYAIFCGIVKAQS